MNLYLGTSLKRQSWVGLSRTTKLLALSLTFLADHFFLAFLPPEEELGLAATSFFAYHTCLINWIQNIRTGNDG